MKRSREINKLITALILLLGISACHDSSRSAPTPSSQPPALSTDATLSAFTLSAGNLAPTFASGTTNYTLTTSNDSITVTPTLNQANATITVNGTAITSGAVSTSIPLAVGDTIINIVVTAQDGSTNQTYTVTINRPPILSTDATLSGLTVSAGDIAPTFVSGTTNYTLTTSSDATTVTPTLNQANAIITVNGTAITSGAASASIPLVVGDTIINIVVTAEDGSTTQTYTVTINRPPFLSTDATLSGLSVSAGDIEPVFASGITNYTLTSMSTSTTVTPTVTQAGAIVTVNGTAVLSGAASASIPITLGNTAISIIVTAEDGSATQTYIVTVTDNSPISTLELIDPFPGAGDRFGSVVVQLANGNIVVSDPSDDTMAINSGAVHLYNPTSSMPIASIFDTRGSNITALGNNNFVITAATSGVTAATLKLVSGSTGAQIGSTIAGEITSVVTALDNNNFVIATSGANDVFLLSVGTIRLMDGNTGMQIGTTLTGDEGNDRLGSGGISVLGNNNYVIASPAERVDGIQLAGSVRLMDGTTGTQINILAGDFRLDQLGNRGVTVLDNNNYVIASGTDDGTTGTVRLMNGATGEQIGGAQGLSDDDTNSPSNITVLDNNNYVIADGVVQLVNGLTGARIGDILVADQVDARLGLDGITALGNNNYVIASSADDVGVANDNSGSVRLINGATGLQIGILWGESGDELGSEGTTALVNNNYVIASSLDAEGGISFAGSVRLADGSTGLQIGATLAGDVEHDALGSTSITALGNSNYVITSSVDNEGGIIDAGSVRLVNGSTGVPIGPILAGDTHNDILGAVLFIGDNVLGGIIALDNSNYVVPSRFDDEGGIVDAGSVRLMDGNTGGAIGAAIVGVAEDDMEFVRVSKPVSGSYYILSQPRADNIGLLDAGMVRIVMP